MLVAYGCEVVEEWVPQQELRARREAADVAGDDEDVRIEDEQALDWFVVALP